MLVSYPQILPPQGACPLFGSDERAIDLMREVGRRLHATTLEAARRTAQPAASSRASDNAASAGPRRSAGR